MTPEAIDGVLAEFRSWLEELAAAEETGAPHETGGSEPAPVDLHTVVSQFVALRHEVHLQTRAARNQQEQNQQTLDQLQRTFELLSRAQPALGELEQQKLDAALGPLLKTLVELGDALRQAQGMLRRSRQSVEEELRALTAGADWGGAAPPPRLARLVAALIDRLYGRESRRAARRNSDREADAACERAQAASQRVLQLTDSIITGYTMSLERLGRTFRQYELDEIVCQGQPFDPERMEALETVAGSGRPRGEVVEVVRPGYLWRGKVFRYAQVRVAKGT